MKLILYDKKSKEVKSIHEGVVNVKQEDDSILWRGGKVGGLRDHISFVVIDDNIQVSIGDAVGVEILPYKQEQKIQEIKDNCAKSIFVGFTSTTTGHDYDFELKDQLNFNMQYSFLLNNTNITNIDWTTNDAGTVSHSRDEFFNVCQDAEIYKRNNIGKYWSLKSQVENATTIDEIETIKW
jgi:hypothetical protein